MCAEFTLVAETDFGDLHILCDKYWECLADHVHALPEESVYEGREFDDEMSDVAAPEPVALDLFKSFEATVAIIELSYFDADFRSEFGAVHETFFAAASPDVLRIHFFDGDAPTDLMPMRDYVESARTNYRGYTIIRPQIPTSIGRSVVAAPGSRGPLREGLSVAERVRTAVVEELNLFGVPLQVHGVPFMEQDGHLLRCAHVVSWMAHYTAVLKGTAARIPSGDLNRSSDSVLSLGRPYPSPGASDFGFTQLLGRVGLPPEHISGARFGAPRPLEWYDNKSFLDQVRLHRDRAEPSAPDSEGVDRLWMRNNITGTICRYLNSGIPSVFNKASHSVLICGYFRERDRCDGDPAVSAVAGFFVQDDQAGPFTVLTVDEMVDAIQAEPSRTSVIVPLPRGLWLSGQKAESAGAVAFRGLVRAVHAQLSRTPEVKRDTRRLEPGGDESPDHSQERVTEPRDPAIESAASPDVDPEGSLLAQFDDLLKQVTKREAVSNLTIRSYAMEGADFKVDFAARVGSIDAQRTVGYVPMPKYVWVIEVLDRALHKDGKPPVRATIVLDGSASSYDATRLPIPLMAHLPGHVSRLLGPEEGHDGWLPTTAEPYASGRWTGAAEGFHLSAMARAHRAKSASR